MNILVQRIDDLHQIDKRKKYPWVGTKAVNFAKKIACYIAPAILNNTDHFDVESVDFTILEHIHFDLKFENYTLHFCVGPLTCQMTEYYIHKWTMDNPQKMHERIFDEHDIYKIINKIKTTYHQNRSMNCAVYTGSFNPPTLAHKDIIDHCSSSNTIGCVIVALSNQTCLDKKQSRNNDWAYTEEQRLEMMLAMTYKNLRVLIYGIERGSTYDTLCRADLRFKALNRVSFIVGSDKLNQMQRWRDNKKLFNEFDFHILQRDSDDTNKTKITADRMFSSYENTSYTIDVVGEAPSDISATQARRLIDNSQPIDQLLDVSVIRVINQLDEVE